MKKVSGGFAPWTPGERTEKGEGKGKGGENGGEEGNGRGVKEREGELGSKAIGDLEAKG
jgi:hypothetical protein